MSPQDDRPPTDLAEAIARYERAEALNERLGPALRGARDQIVALKEEVDRLAQPPCGYGYFLWPVTHAEAFGLCDVWTGGRKLRVNVSPNLDMADLRCGQEIVLNEALNVVEAGTYAPIGQIMTVTDLLDTERIKVEGNGDESHIVFMAGQVRDELRVGDHVMCDLKANFAFEKILKAEVEELRLEIIPDITYRDIGGLADQVMQIRDAIELPYLHPELFREFRLKPPKGVLLYGPPGCGKTLIAKAVANSLAKQVALKTRGGEGNGKPQHDGKARFISIKGPELLNKYVGETERHIRLLFARARELADEGYPVIVFFDEMESLFHTRGSGVSSDIENTIVPQLLSEIDGVESLSNVIVIGATNREDMIDPAILRPGRLDVKIKVERPDAEAAKDIFGKYVLRDLPFHPDLIGEQIKDGRSADDVVAACDDHRKNGTALSDDINAILDDVIEALIFAGVERTYEEVEENRFLEVTYANGDKEVLYFKDFMSGAMIQSIVDRAKREAIKSFLSGDRKGMSKSHMTQACVEEFGQNEDLPNTTNPDDWARISGKKGERIVYVRTLVAKTAGGNEAGRSIDTIANTGQYL
jgi:proteasome-associated ATPase